MKLLSAQSFEDFTGTIFKKAKHLQDLLSELQDPQVELLFLCHCLSCCKIVHVLHTIPPHMYAYYF